MSLFIFVTMRSNSKLYASEISLNPTDGYILIYKTPNLEKRYPRGFLLFTTLIKDEKGNYIKNEKLVKRLEIIGPEGKVFKTINNSPYNASSSASSGYEIFTVNGYKRWKGYDIEYDGHNLPKGDYSVQVIGISGKKASNTMTFRSSSDPIKGYPTNIKYDTKKREVSWNGTTGQTGYRVIVFKSVQGISPENKNMIYYSGFKKGELVKGTSFILPEETRLESGKQYFIIIAAHDSEDNTSEKMNYLHFQDDKNEMAIFTVP
jgi:hypothetical protein